MDELCDADLSLQHTMTCGKPRPCPRHEPSAVKQAEADQRELERMAYRLMRERGVYGHNPVEKFVSVLTDRDYFWTPFTTGRYETFDDAIRAAHAVVFGGRDGE